MCKRVQLERIQGEGGPGQHQFAGMRAVERESPQVLLILVVQDAADVQGCVSVRVNVQEQGGDVCMEVIFLDLGRVLVVLAPRANLCGECGVRGYLSVSSCCDFNLTCLGQSCCNVALCPSSVCVSIFEIEAMCVSAPVSKILFYHCSRFHCDAGGCVCDGLVCVCGASSLDLVRMGTNGMCSCYPCVTLS